MARHLQRNWFGQGGVWPSVDQAVAMIDVQLGRRLGQFVLEEPLDPGGGSVYRGISIEHRCSVAVKLLPRELVSSEHRLDQFVRELQFLRTLRHPNIAMCHGGGVHDGDPYVVLEWVRGESAREMLRRVGRLPWQEAVQFAIKVCEALEYVHQRNVFHGQLTPEKIVIAESGEVKLTGFRAQGNLEAGCYETQRLQERSQQLGAVAYMAPEQIQGQTNVTSRSDLYALGCILFEWLTGRPPFVADNPLAVARGHLHQPPPRVASLASDCPVWLDALVARLLEKQPSRRPPFASGVAHALHETLEKVASATSVLAHAASGQPSTLTPAVPISEARKALGLAPPKRDWSWIKRLALPAGALAVIVAMFVWALWPASEKTLYLRAKAIMEAGDDGQWDLARRNYLEPLLERFPQGTHAPQAQLWLDQIEADLARKRINWHAAVGRGPETLAEERILRAERYEKFGDVAGALQRYDALASDFQADANERPFAALARQAARRIRGAGNIPPTVQVLREKLAAAHAADGEGKVELAERIWREILSLYGGDSRWEPFCQQARERLP